MFLNRLDELTSLKERFYGSSAEMVIIYGRRRVGKSELIDQFIGNFSGISGTVSSRIQKKPMHVNRDYYVLTCPIIIYKHQHGAWFGFAEM